MVQRCKAYPNFMHLDVLDIVNLFTPGTAAYFGQIVIFGNLRDKRNILLTWLGRVVKPSIDGEN